MNRKEARKLKAQQKELIPDNSYNFGKEIGVTKSTIPAYYASGSAPELSDELNYPATPYEAPSNAIGYWEDVCDKCNRLFMNTVASEVTVCPDCSRSKCHYCGYPGEDLIMIPGTIEYRHPNCGNWNSRRNPNKPNG